MITKLKTPLHPYNRRLISLSLIILNLLSKMEIKIRSTQFVKPSKSTPENLRNFKLSLLDQLASSLYTNMILYYNPSHDQVNAPDRCGQLVKSLSQVLTLFYPLAGRIKENGVVVDCGDQGVKYLETQVSIKLDEFLKQGPKVDHVRQLVGALDRAVTELVTVQVNVFECGSIVIGVSGSHKVSDAYNLVRFINEWANMNRTGGSNGGSHGAFSPSFDRLDSIFPPREVSLVNHSPVTVDQKAVVVTRRLLFNGSTISKLRAKANSSTGNYKHSRVTLVASLIWKVLISVDQVKNGRFRNCLLAPAINFRGKMGPPISESSFGNVWAPYPIRFFRNEMEPEFGNLVSLIEDTTRNFVTWLSKASCEEICRRVLACYAEAYEEIKQNKFCILTSWCRFRLYEADFGWGKPVWVSEAGRSHDMVTLMDDKDGDGIEAWVSLNEKDMCVFEQDDDILEFIS